MKPKKANQKLFLKKTTIANLNTDEMRYVHGGLAEEKSLEKTLCDCTTTCPSESYFCTTTCPSESYDCSNPCAVTE